MTSTKETQLKNLKAAESLIKGGRYDAALDLLTSGKCGSEVASYFLNEYITKKDLATVKHIKDSQWGNEYQVDQLNGDKWYRCGRFDHDADTAWISRAGAVMLYDVKNCIALA